MKRMGFGALAALLWLAPVVAGAQGHMLHGVGPVNSAMGGAGVAAPNESLGALMFNPALVGEADGNQVSFSTEFFSDAINITTTIGNQVGFIAPKHQMGILPAFGWQYRAPNSKLGIGFGLLAVAGFKTDYDQNDASLLFAQPPNGFGRIYTDLRVTKVPVAMAYQVTPKLTVGVSGNFYVSEFAVAPLPYKYFDVDTAGNRWYEEAGAMTSRYAVAAQAGFLYKHSDTMSIGGSVTTPQNFGTFRWNSTNANPGSPNFGKASQTEFDLDGPMIVTAGTAVRPTKKTVVAVDGMFTKYRGVHGFGGPGGVIVAASTPGLTGGNAPGGIVDPFGWRNVWTIKGGVQHQATNKLVVRAGYNYSQMPVVSENVLSATGAPATFQHHLTAGFGFRIFPFLEAEVSAYYVPRQHLVGPLKDLFGRTTGTLDESNRLRSALVGLNYKF